MPLAASRTITAASHGGQHPVGVLGEVAVAGGVEQVDHAVAGTANCSTVEVIEMPRCCSSSIQSDVAERRAPLRLDRAGLSPSAPPYSSSFSVRVVLPASGCEMIANVRRRAACATGSAGVLTTRGKPVPADSAKVAGSQSTAASTAAMSAAVRGSPARPNCIWFMTYPNDIARSGSANPTDPPAP